MLVIHQFITTEVWAPRDLLNWHKTCQAFYNDWCDPPYLYNLLHAAIDRGLTEEQALCALCNSGSRKRQRLSIRLATVYAHLAALDQLRLTVGIGSHLDRIIPGGEWVLASVDPVVGTTLKFPNTTLARLCSLYDDKRIDTTMEVLPMRLQLACQQLSAFVEQVYGWTVQFGRRVGQTEHTLVLPGDEIKMTDVIWLRLACIPE